ncbi:MAG: hypothetical protein D8H95_23765 [Lachnospiraceae bacterium]|nr:dynamin family protein [uncultured Lachnoanaerobaculum sp.]RKW47744.1 MAG: hypothetical protein D8H95_23765 [Lachnospiraceae bacterium]
MNIEKGIEIATWLGKDQDVYMMEGLKRLEDRGEHFVTFWGHYSAGKSRLINNIIGRDILPVQSRESTAALTYIRYGNLEQCVVHFLDKSEKNVELSELKKINQNDAKDIDLDSIDYIEVFLPDEVLKTGMIIVDTPGINTIVKKHQDLAVDAIEQSGMIVYVLGSSPTNVDRDFITQIDECGIDILFVRTKCDLINSVEEDSTASIEKDRILLQSMISQEVNLIPISNEETSSWFANLDKIHNVLDGVSANIKDKIKLSRKHKLDKCLCLYKEELENQSKLMKEQLCGSSKKLDEEIAKYDNQLELLQAREEQGENRIKSELEDSKKQAKRNLEDIAEKESQNLREKLGELKWSMNIKNDADKLYKTQIDRGLKEAYVALNNCFNMVLESENSSIEKEFSDIDFEAPEVEIGMMEHDNERWRATLQEKISTINRELDNLSERKSELDLQSQSGLSDEDIQAAKLELERINKAISDIPTDPAMVEVESSGMKPSEVLKVIGQVADIATILLPGDAFVQGAKALAGTAKFSKILGKSKYILEAGKNIAGAANVVDTIRDASLITGKLNKVMGKISKKEAVTVFVEDKARKAQDAFDKFKENNRDTNIFDMLSIAYWTEKLGKNFDAPPHLEIDYDEEARRKELRAELERQKNIAMETMIKQKKELHIIQNAKEEAAEREKFLEQKKDWIEKEERRQEERGRKEREKNEKNIIVEHYTEHFRTNIDKLLNELLIKRIKLVGNNIEFYIARKNDYIRQSIFEKKGQLESLKNLRSNGDEELKQRIQQCDQYIQELS